MHRTSSLIGLALVLFAAIAYMLWASPTTTEQGGVLAHRPQPELATPELANDPAPTLSAAVDSRTLVAALPGPTLDNRYEDTTFGSRLTVGRPVQVVAASTNEPLPGAIITWLSWSDYEGPDADFTPGEMRSDWLSFVRPEVAMLEEGATFTADEDGRLFLPAEAGLAMGRSGQLWALQELGLPIEEPAQLALGPVTDLIVDLVDHLGAPAGGVELWLVEKNGLWPEEYDYVTTDPLTGRAVIPHAGAFLKALSGRNAVGEKARPFYLIAAVVSLDPCMILIDPKDFPKAPIRLQLPPMGSVEIGAVYPNGTPVEDPWMRAYVRSYGADESKFPADFTSDVMSHTKAQETGQVWLKHIGLGLALEISVDSPNTAVDETLSLKGPTQPGERVALSFPVPYAYNSVTVVLLDPQGEPVQAGRNISARISISWQGQDRSSTRHLISGPGGMCRIRADGWPRISYAETFSILFEDRFERTRYTASLKSPGPFVGPDMDFGTIQFQPPTHIVTGYVKDVAGDPIFGARIAAWGMLKDGKGGWIKGKEVEVVWVRSDVNGRFSVEAAFDGTHLQLHAVHRQYMDGHSKVIESGAEGVTITLPSSGTILGHIRADNPSVLGLLGISAKISTSDAKEDQGDKLYSSDVSKDGSFELAGLDPGTYTVSIQGIGLPEALFQVDNVVVAGGAGNKDPRLQGIELPQVTPIIISILDQLGDPIIEGAVFRGHAEQKDRRNLEYIAGFTDGQCQLLSNGVPQNLTIRAARYFATELFGISSDATVSLDSWPRISITFDAASPSIEAPYFLSYYVDNDGLDWDYFSPDGQEIIEQGKADVLQIGPPEDWYLEFELNASFSPGITDSTFIDQELQWFKVQRDPGEQTIEVHLDPDKVKAAMDVLRERNGL